MEKEPMPSYDRLCPAIVSIFWNTVVGVSKYKICTERALFDNQTVVPSITGGIHLRHGNALSLVFVVRVKGQYYPV